MRIITPCGGHLTFSLQAHIFPFLLENQSHWLPSPAPPQLPQACIRTFQLALSEGEKFLGGVVGRCSLKAANSYSSIHLWGLV